MKKINVEILECNEMPVFGIGRVEFKYTGRKKQNEFLLESLKYFHEGGYEIDIRSMPKDMYYFLFRQKEKSLREAA